jgi:hypothetical protein
VILGIILRDSLGDILHGRANAHFSGFNFCADVGVKETFGDRIRIFIVIHMLMVAAMLAGPKQYGILKRSGSEKNGEEPHNPVFKAHT